MSSFREVIVSSGAFAKPTNILQNIPFDKVTLGPQNAPHSLYEELYHLDYWQSFILAVIEGKKPAFPKHNSESFPARNEVSLESWQALVDKVLKDLQIAADLTENTELATKDTGFGVTLHEELISLAAHNAYHFGRVVMLRQLLGIWSAGLGNTW